MLAHDDLVRKARSGRIDLYFLGDSITRRWGCSDVQYAPLLAHWRRSFHGWNAGNFGWGSDRIEHMLWRVNNGELDGVNPTVIVLLAGTNNFDATPGSEARERRIVTGIAALIAACQTKAPAARIILMGIFVRNDSMELVPEIRRINARLARLADGERVRFLDVNDRLADAEGRLHEGVAVDGLHLDVKGYDIWAQALRPLLEEMLGPRSEHDEAPPPTGEPALE